MDALEVFQADVKWQKDRAPTDVKSKFIAKLESVYGGRYSNVALVVLLYRKWGVKAMVGFYHHFILLQDALQAITTVLGVDGPTFLCTFVLDVVTQMYYEGNGNWLKQLPDDGSIVRLKEPYPFALPWMGDQYGTRRLTQYQMEYKGYDVYELRRHVKSTTNRDIKDGDTVTVTWSMADKQRWRMVSYNGYGRNGFYKIDGKTCVFMPMDAGREQTVLGSAGTLTVSNVEPGPVFFAMIAAEPGVDTTVPPSFAVTIQ